MMMLDQRQSSTSDVACRLAQTNFIVDRFHAAAHTVRYCSQHCLPSLPQNEEIQADFPTDAAETVNSQFSPLGHVIHHTCS